MDSIRSKTLSHFAVGALQISAQSNDLQIYRVSSDPAEPSLNQIHLYRILFLLSAPGDRMGYSFYMSIYNDTRLIINISSDYI